MFKPLHSSANQELIEKHLCNQSSLYEKYGRFPLRKGSHHLLLTKSTLFTVNKDEWDTKEDTVHEEYVVHTAVRQKASLAIEQ